MILQALNEYYERKKLEPDSGLPLYGYSIEKIDYEIVLNEKGDIVQIADLASYEGKKKTRKELNVPKVFQGKKGSGIKSNFLWEESGYIFGYDSESTERAIEKHDAFKKLHGDIGKDISCKGMQAVLLFLGKWNPEDSRNIEDWSKLEKNKFVFRLDGETKFIYEDSAIQESIDKYMKTCLDSEEDSFTLPCLVSGELKPIEILHNGIKGIMASEHDSNVLIGFQKQRTAFCSYGKDGLQGLNSPVSKMAAFQYTTAMNYLINTAKQCVHNIGDATTVFWAEKPSPLEDLFAEMFNPPQEDKGTVSDVRRFLQALRAGIMPKEIDAASKFYVLGLSPSASRLAIRFWCMGTVGDFSEHVGRHFRDIRIEHSHENDKEFPGLWGLLSQLKSKKTKEDIPKEMIKISGDLARSILNGKSYPNNILAMLLNRIRAGEEVNYLRASMIKGILVRNHGKEVSMSWDKDKKDTAYLLGGLFAILEKTQKDAGNETIREKYFKSASSTPKTAYSVLIPLAQHHIAKAEYGWKNDQAIAEIMENISEFPAFLNLQDQGVFALGYYHMRNKISRDIQTAIEAKKIKSSSDNKEG